MADWIAVAANQAKVCRAAHGVQPVGGLGGLSTAPFTPGGFAFQAYAFWNGQAPIVFDLADKEGKDTGDVDLSAIVASNLFLSPIPKQVAETTGSAAVKQSATRVDLALRTMLDAMARGANPGTRNGEGLLCLDGIQVARYWDSISALGREYTFLTAGTSIPVSEKIAAVREGARDGLKNVGDAAGQALAAAGEGAGILGSSFLGGFGVLNTAAVLGGGYLAVRYVF